MENQSTSRKVAKVKLLFLSYSSIDTNTTSYNTEIFRRHVATIESLNEDAKNKQYEHMGKLGEFLSFRYHWYQQAMRNLIQELNVDEVQMDQWYISSAKLKTFTIDDESFDNVVYFSGPYVAHCLYVDSNNTLRWKMKQHCPSMKNDVKDVLDYYEKKKLRNDLKEQEKMTKKQQCKELKEQEKKAKKAEKQMQKIIEKTMTSEDKENSHRNKHANNTLDCVAAKQEEIFINGADILKSQNQQAPIFHIETKKSVVEVPQVLESISSPESGTQSGSSSGSDQQQRNENNSKNANCSPDSGHHSGTEEPAPDDLRQKILNIASNRKRKLYCAIDDKNRKKFKRVVNSLKKHR